MPASRTLRHDEENGRSQRPNITRDEIELQRRSVDDEEGDNYEGEVQLHLFDLEWSAARMEAKECIAHGSSTGALSLVLRLLCSTPAIDPAGDAAIEDEENGRSQRPNITRDEIELQRRSVDDENGSPLKLDLVSRDVWPLAAPILFIFDRRIARRRGTPR
jgi:hypothetical protein